MPNNSPTSTEQVIERAYREGYRNGFVDATITEDGYPDESIVLKRVSEVSLAEGWDACRDKFLDTSEEMETCDQCGGAGGDNQHWVCDKCGGTGGYPANTPVDSEVERLRHLVRQYVDPFDVAPADHALVIAIGTDDEAGYRAAIASLPPKPVDGDVEQSARESRVLTDQKTALLRSAVERRVAARTQPVDGEVAELVERLRDAARAYAGMLHAQHAFDCRRAADMLLALSRKTEPMATDVTPAMIHEGAAAYYDCVPVSTLSPECVADTISAIYLAMLSAGEKGTDDG